MTNINSNKPATVCQELMLKVFTEIVAKHEIGRPLNEFLSDVRKCLLDSLMFFSNCDVVVHFFWNERTLSDGKNEWEWDWMNRSGNKQDKIKTAPDDAGKTIYGLLKKGGDMEVFAQISKDEARWLLLRMGCNDHVESANVILAPFGIGTPYKLGWFLIGNSESTLGISYNDGDLYYFITQFRKFVLEFLKSEYGVRESTYLPSFATPGNKEVAILFADIRNFTPLSEFLRIDAAARYAKGGNNNKLQEIIREYHDEMFKCIEEQKEEYLLGRVDGFMGDGLLAFFGEYEGAEDYKARRRAVAKALLAAKRMLECFNRIEQTWKSNISTGLRPGITRPFAQVWNESLATQLAIGINFGEVTFDYFGANNKKDYTAVGDHMNFAQRLESEACRWDTDRRKTRPPVLVSQTVMEHLKVDEQTKGYILNSGNSEGIEITLKGKSMRYQVYGLTRENIETIEPHLLSFIKN